MFSRQLLTVIQKRTTRGFLAGIVAILLSAVPVVQADAQTQNKKYKNIVAQLKAMAWNTSCSADIVSMCRDVKNGHGRIYNCLSRNKAKLTDGCRTILPKAKALVAQLTQKSAKPARAQTKKPNILLIFLDNFGWGEPGFNGGGIIRGAPTPAMDALAAEGLRLTNFNVEVQCTPSRSAIMTGRYAIRSGNGTVPLGEGEYGLVQWEVTMAEMLSAAGYKTGMYGKWHLGRTKGRFPTDQGFDEWYGVPNSTDESVYSSLQGFAKSGVAETFVMESKKGSLPKKVRPYRLDYRPLIDRDLTDRAIDFMKRQAKANNPFFVYLPYTATHFPTMPHPDFVGKSGKGPWGDLLMQVDSYVGELLGTIKDLGIDDDTIVIFTADNGPEALSAGETSLTVETAMHGSAGPWRSTLFTGYEGALRVPFAMRWPGKIKPGRVNDEIVHEMDLFPTLARIAGGKVPSDRVIDGMDMSQFLLGRTAESGRDGFIVYMGKDIFGVKWRDWKLHFKEQTGWNGALREYTMPRVYNLINDPQERDNVLFPHTWVPKAALPQLQEHVASLKKYPPIPASAPDPYEPPY